MFIYINLFVSSFVSINLESSIWGVVLKVRYLFLYICCVWYYCKPTKGIKHWQLDSNKLAGHLFNNKLGYCKSAFTCTLYNLTRKCAEKIRENLTVEISNHVRDGKKEHFLPLYTNKLQKAHTKLTTRIFYQTASSHLKRIHCSWLIEFSLPEVLWMPLQCERVPG